MSSSNHNSQSPHLSLLKFAAAKSHPETFSRSWGQIVMYCSASLLFFKARDVTLRSVGPCLKCSVMTKQDQPSKSIPA